MGYSRKNPHPHPPTSTRRKARFLDPSFLLDFQNCQTPPPLRISNFKQPPPPPPPASIQISIKSLDAKIFIYYKCYRLSVAFRWSFLSNYTRLCVWCEIEDNILTFLIGSGEGMQLSCTLHFKAKKILINILKKEL